MTDIGRSPRQTQRPAMILFLCMMLTLCGVILGGMYLFLTAVIDFIAYAAWKASR